MSLRKLNFKQWTMIVILTIWFLCNLSFTPQKEGVPYFRVHNIESAADEIAENRAAAKSRRDRQKRQLFWNKHKKAADATPVAIIVERSAPEEMYLGMVPKARYTFLQKVSPRNAYEVWRGITKGAYREVEPTPDNVVWGFWTPIIIIALLTVCILFGGNIFAPLRRELKALPTVDRIPDEDEEEEDEEEEEEEEEEEIEEEIEEEETDN